MVKGLKVPLEVGKEVRGLLKRKRLYEDTHLPRKEKGYIILPIREGAEVREITKEYSISDYDLRKNERTRSFRRELEKILPKEIFKKASRAYEQIGDIGIISVFDSMKPYEKEIARALLETNKGIRLVLKKTAKHAGKKRIQEYVALEGTGSTQTTHQENGVEIALDVTHVYFSGRTAQERKRISSLIRDPESVLVLFSGCAPFPLVIAKNSPAKEIIGVEINKEAHNYGVKNVKSNQLNNTTLLCDDATHTLRTFDKKFDRIVLPHPTKADYYLSDSLTVLKNRGIIHMYLFSKEEKIEYVKKKIINVAAKNDFKVKKIVVVEQMAISSEVKKYCFDIYLVKSTP